MLPILTVRSVYKELHTNREMDCRRQTAICSRRGWHIARVVVGDSKGVCPLTHEFEKQSVVCLRSVSVATSVPLPSWKTRVFKAAGKRTGHIWKLPSFAPPQP